MARPYADISNTQMIRQTFHKRPQWRHRPRPMANCFVVRNATRQTALCSEERRLTVVRCRCPQATWRITVRCVAWKMNKWFRCSPVCEQMSCLPKGSSFMAKMSDRWYFSSRSNENLWPQHSLEHFWALKFIMRLDWIETLIPNMYSLALYPSGLLINFIEAEVDRSVE